MTNTRPLPPGQLHGHVHGEAFCHMRYANADRSLTRSVWNSRDGVTPFGFTDPETSEAMTHVDWGGDRYDPRYAPRVGDFVWVDLHPEKAMQKAYERVEFFWDHADYPLRENGMTKDEAARMFFEEFTTRLDPETMERVPMAQPDLIIWDEAWSAREKPGPRPNPRPIRDRPQA